MGKKSGPPPPDYTGAAEKTAQSNKEAVTAQTWANRADQYSPFGSTTWDTQKYVDPATGQQVTKWVQNTNLTPETQAALDSQMAVQMARSQQAEDLIGRMQSEFGGQMDWSQLPDWANTAGIQAGGLEAITNPFGFGPQQQRLQRGLDFSGVQDVGSGAEARAAAENAIYSQAASRLDPRFQQSQTDLETQLANQGISRNSEAYSRAMDDFNRQKTDAYNQAQMSAITGGGAEAQRNQGMDLALRGQQVGEIGTAGNFFNQAALGQYGMGLQGANFNLGREQQAFGQEQQAGQQNFNQQMALANYQNQLRQMQLQEMMGQRGFSLNEMNALLTGQQVGMPQFSGYNQAGNAGGVDYTGATKDQFGAAMDQQKMKNEATSQMVGGIASMAMMFSDIATKQLIAPVAMDPRGFRIWWFRYFGETLPRLGVVAQEVREHAPELVRVHRCGLLMVDYSKL